MIEYHFKVEEGVTKEKLYKFFDGRNYFLHLPNLMNEFMWQYQIYGAQQTVDHLNLFKSMLDSRKYVYPLATFHLIILALDTGASFVLTPFKADFVDYV